MRKNNQFARSVSSLVLMRTGGQGPPLFLIHGVDGDISRFRDLVNHLHSAQPIYAIRSQALLKPRIAYTRVEELARLYLADMRAQQPHGPYHILGFSFGGLVGFEIARLLHASGERGGMLGMIDPRPMSAATRAPGAGVHALAQPGTWTRVTSNAENVWRPGGMAYARKKMGARALREIYTLLDKLRQPIPRFLQ